MIERDLLTHKRSIISVLLAVLISTGTVSVFSVIPTSSVEVSSLMLAKSSLPTYNVNLNVTTFVSPDCSRDTLWHFLNSARESIYVEIFGINNPYILDLIHQIRAARPTLDIKFLIGWNSLGYVSQNKYVAYNLTGIGIPVRWTAATDFDYAHQKFVIIDNKTTIVQAGNWAKTSFPEAGKVANREWSIAMTNTDVTGRYRAVFDHDWRRGRDYNQTLDGTGTPLTYTQSSSTYPRPFATVGTFSGQMNVTPVFSPDTSLEAILYCIENARVTLDIQIPYFTDVGGGGAVDQIINAIIAAHNRGVTVRVITEEEKDYLEIADILHQHNIPIVWHDTRWFTANHNKGIIADGRIVLVSSINYSDESITENREAGVIIEHTGVAQWFQAVFDYDWALADCDVQNNVNVYWSPNIPRSTDDINVTVYGHMLYALGIDEVRLDVKIGTGPWNNHTITANVYRSAEGDLENYWHLIPAQPDGTDVTVVGRIRIANGTWYIGVPMVIHVRDSLGWSPTTTTTTSPQGQDFWTQYGPLIILIVAFILGGGAVFVRQPTRRRRTKRGTVTRVASAVAGTAKDVISTTSDAAGSAGGTTKTSSSAGGTTQKRTTQRRRKQTPGS